MVDSLRDHGKTRGDMRIGIIGAGRAPASDAQYTATTGLPRHLGFDSKLMRKPYLGYEFPYS